MRTFFKRFAAIMLALAMTVCFTALTAFADSEVVCSLTLVCETDDSAVEGMTWSIYRIGSHTDQDEFVLEDDFADYEVSFDDLSTSAVQQLADTLQSYVENDNISSLSTAITDSAGTATFSSLSEGLYLVCAETLSTDESTIVPSPSIIELSSDDADVTAYPKFTVASSDSSITDEDSSTEDSSSETSSDDASSDTETSTATSEETSSSTTTTDTIPPTGERYTAIPILALAGLVFIALGVRVCVKKEREDE